ncbi:hypothetical protein V1514DRAFT_291703 [Lipomyces japonicus]|uniref:uncharacterized protein n=1 Tax=Lipomyces japonicus TaxID=56871 RepID=UPI0034CE95CD
MATRIPCVTFDSGVSRCFLHNRRLSRTYLVAYAKPSKSKSLSRPYFRRTYATGNNQTEKGTSFINSVFSAFWNRLNRQGKNPQDWETRRVASDIKDGYEPNDEWEALQQLSALIRAIKTELKPEENAAEFENIEYDLKQLIDDLLSKLARDELPIVHVRLVNEAWNIMYTTQIGSVQESSNTEVVFAEDAPRRYFNIEELKKLLYFLARFEDPSEHHVMLGRKVYQTLMQKLPQNDPTANDQFLLFVLLLSRNKADKEMILAFNGLLHIMKSVNENSAIALVTIINNVSDQNVQEILVAKLFQAVFLDIGGFNVILQSAIENNQKNIWKIHDQVFKSRSTYNLEPNLDTYELLFRYIVEDPFSERSKQFVKDVKSVLFESETVPALDIVDNQSLYRSYLTAAMVTGQQAVAERLYTLFSDEEMLELLEKESWQVVSQSVCFFQGSIESVRDVLKKMTVHGYGVDTATINGLIRAAQLRKDINPEFRQAIFELYEAYSVSLDTTSVGLRIYDRVSSGRVDEAVQVFKSGISDGLSWNPKKDDMSALFVMLEGLSQSNDFDAQLLVEIYLAVRVYIGSVSYPTRLAMLKAFIKHGEYGNAKDFLKQELGDTFKYTPDIFPEMYEFLLESVLSSATVNAAWMTYGCLHQHFIPAYESYLPVMSKLCQLDYSSAALELFRHVRKGTTTPPGTDMYALLFREFARTKYTEGIDELFHCYKLDLNIDPDIELFNGMLEACRTGGLNHLSYTLWQQIRIAATSSDTTLLRQPNSETFSLLLKIASSTGTPYADEIWNEFLNYPVIKTAEHYKYYVAAYCASGDLNKAFNILKNMELLPAPAPSSTSSEKLTSAGDVINVLYNYVETPAAMKIIEDWATLVHPHEWTKVGRVGPLIQSIRLLELDASGRKQELQQLAKEREDAEKKLSNISQSRLLKETGSVSRGNEEF